MSDNGSAFDVPEPDEALLDQVASQLELRTPNRDAIEVLALRMHQWYERDRGVPHDHERGQQHEAGRRRERRQGGAADEGDRALGLRRCA